MDWKMLVADSLKAMTVNSSVTVIDDGVKITYETDPESGIVTDVYDIEVQKKHRGKIGK